MARNHATYNKAIGEFLRTMFHEWAMRDADVLEMIARRLGEETAPRRDINVKADRAAVRARRIAMEMLDEESGAVHAEPGSECIGIAAGEGYSIGSQGLRTRCVEVVAMRRTKGTSSFPGDAWDRCGLVTALQCCFTIARRPSSNTAANAPSTRFR